MHLNIYAIYTHTSCNNILSVIWKLHVIYYPYSMLSNTKCVLSSEPVSNKDVTINKRACVIESNHKSSVLQNITLVLIMFYFSLHCINKMLRSRVAHISNNIQTSDPYSFINYYVIKIWQNRSC